MMDGKKGGKRYSTERQERLKNVKNVVTQPVVVPKPEQTVNYETVLGQAYTNN